MADVHIKLAIRLAHLLHEVWNNIRFWQHEQKKSIAQLSDPPDVLKLLDPLYVNGILHSVSKDATNCCSLKPNVTRALNRMEYRIVATLHKCVLIYTNLTLTVVGIEYSPLFVYVSFSARYIRNQCS